MTPKSTRRAAFAARVALLSLPVSALVAGSPALAAPAYNWTGMYVGFYAGGVWGNGKSTGNSKCGTGDGAAIGGYFCDTNLPASLANADAVYSAGSGSVSSTKFTGGIQAGYNWQDGNVVLGVETDFGSFNINGSRSASGVFTTGGGFGGSGVVPGDAFTVSNSFNTDWLFTTRGRFGWAASNWLVFATGGVALSRVSITNSYSDNHTEVGIVGTNATVSESKLKVGFTLGGGVEVALTRNWSIKGEYLYVNLGSVSVLGNVFHPNNPGYANALGVTTELTAHIARLGANFRF
jgi:outer membrane immunogenic protein